MTEGPVEIACDVRGSYCSVRLRDEDTGISAFTHLLSREEALAAAEQFREVADKLESFGRAT